MSFTKDDEKKERVNNVIDGLIAIRINLESAEREMGKQNPSESFIKEKISYIKKACNIIKKEL